jgi:ABC-type transport system involved in multi-copper enzyme maturation permease subunit
MSGTASGGLTVMPHDEGTRLARTRDAIGAEWIKLRSLRSTWWVIGSALGIFVLVGVLTCHYDVTGWAERTREQQAGFDALPEPLIGYLIAQVAFAAIGVLSITGEYSTGQIRTTFTALPSRPTVLGAKALAIAALTLVTATVATLTAFVTGQAILSGKHVGLSLTDPGVGRAVTATIAYLVAAALLGLGLGAIFRHVVPSICVLVAFLFLIPQMLHGTRGWIEQVSNALPATALHRLIINQPWEGAPSVFESWVSILIYPAVTLGIARILIVRRDS